MEQDTETLLERILHLQTIAVKLSKLAGVQQGIIEQEELETFEAILRQKQNLIDQLLEYPKLKLAFEQSLLDKREHGHSQLSHAVREIEDTLKFISLVEQSTMNAMRASALKTERELRRLTQTHQATGCYNQTNVMQPKRRLDITS